MQGFKKFVLLAGYDWDWAVTSESASITWLFDAVDGQKLWKPASVLPLYSLTFPTGYSAFPKKWRMYMTMHGPPNLAWKRQMDNDHSSCKPTKAKPSRNRCFASAISAWWCDDVSYFLGGRWGLVKLAHKNIITWHDCKYTKNKHSLHVHVPKKQLPPLVGCWLSWPFLPTLSGTKIWTNPHHFSCIVPLTEISTSLQSHLPLLLNSKFSFLLTKQTSFMFLVKSCTTWIKPFEHPWNNGKN